MKNLILLLLFSFQLTSCQNKVVNETPKEYIAKVNVLSETYRKDSLELVNAIRKDIEDHTGGYKSKIYDTESKVIIDTIMYSPNNERIFFFVITKGKNRKLYPQEMSDQEMIEASKYTRQSLDGFYFEGKAYVAYKKNDLIFMTQFYGITTARYDNIKSVRKRQRQIFFKEFSSINEEGYEYNINDIRFWENDFFWNKMKEKLNSEIEFKEMKKKNPENVYDPNDRK